MQECIIFADSPAALHTRLRGPLKDRDAPFPIFSSLRDSDRELIHAICCQGVYQHPPLVALLVLPPCRLSFFPVPDGVRSVIGKRKRFKYSRGSCSPSCYRHTCFHRFPPCCLGVDCPHFKNRINPGDKYRLGRHDPDTDVLGFILHRLCTKHTYTNSYCTETKMSSSRLYIEGSSRSCLTLVFFFYKRKSKIFETY